MRFCEAPRLQGGACRLRSRSRAGASWAVVDRLLAEGELGETKHDSHLFYLRQFLAGHASTTAPTLQKKNRSPN